MSELNDGFENVQESLSVFMSEVDNKIEHLEAMKNGAYAERNQLVALLSKVFPASIEQHKDVEGEEWEDDWRNLIIIDLPTGQCSWHIHDSELPLFQHLLPGGREWDGHTNEEKYKRVRSYSRCLGL